MIFASMLPIPMTYCSCPKGLTLSEKVESIVDFKLQTRSQTRQNRVNQSRGPNERGQMYRWNVVTVTCKKQITIRHVWAPVKSTRQFHQTLLYRERKKREREISTWPPDSCSLFFLSRTCSTLQRSVLACRSPIITSQASEHVSWQFQQIASLEREREVELKGI